MADALRIQCVVVLSGLVVSCAVPMPVPEKFSLPVPRQEVKTTLPTPLTHFEAEVVDESNYHLGSGDEITIEVWGYKELSGKHTVGPDGRITLPLVGPFKVVNLTREQSAQTAKKALLSYYSDLSVTVRVDKYASNRVLVLGRVSKPGEVQFGMTAPTLLEAIALAGGLSEVKGLEGAQSLPFSRCAIFRGRDRIVWIELEPLLLGKDLSLNLKLQRNDIVYIPDLEEKLVYVLGEVSRPGAFRLTPNMSFIELLARAGGPTRDAAPGRINIIRPQQGVNQALSLHELITPNPNVNVALQEGDIVYVPTNTIAKINYAIQILNPFSSMLGVYADIVSIQADSERHRLDQEAEELRKERDALKIEKERNSTLE